MGKKVSDEKLIEMLLVHGGAGKAAAVLGISKNAIYRRLKDEAFRNEYNRLQGIVLSTATAGLSDALGDAVGLLRDTVNNPTVNDNTRVSAADSLLRHCVRYVEVTDILRRLEALENGNT